MEIVTGMTNKIVVDLDGTITVNNDNGYANAEPNLAVIEKLRQYKEQGYQIIVFSARNMRTYEGNIGKINIHTLPIITDWLTRHGVPFDEVLVGKPWCGHDGFYVDDRAIRPDEFAAMSLEQIAQLLTPPVSTSKRPDL
jgi:capsule biosynthesis phosphatase